MMVGGLDEGYERIKGFLTFHSTSSHKVIVGVSAVAGEGTTTILTNTARILAKTGTTHVLLVDGNFRHPSVHAAFSLENKSGLWEVLSDQLDLESVIQKTPLSHLFVVSAGEPPETLTEVLDLKECQDFIRQAREMFDYVLIDSPSISESSDILNLAKWADGVILIVQAEKTRWEVVHQAKTYLQNGGGNILGVVLNRRRYWIPSFLYHHL